MSRHPPTPPEQWPINNYWRESDEIISQHWYISFCLMMSAVQDYLTGRFLHEKDNLNWSTTCYYYSMVHTGRLIAFCVIGDYPTQHSALRDLYQNGDVQLDWLNKLIRGGIRRRYRMCISSADFYSAAHSLFEGSENNQGSDLQIQSFADQLRRLADLRSDSNYESLLIAHEKHHKMITEGFERLVNAAESVAKESVSLAIKGYKAYVNKSPLLSGHREAFKCISDKYVEGRLFISLEKKVGNSTEAQKKLTQFCDELEFRVNSKNYSKETSNIEEQIAMGTFESKRSLMQNFRDKVNRLVEVSGIGGVENETGEKE